MSEERKVYDLNGHTVEEVKENIEGYLGTIRKMEVQSGPSGDGYIIQARSREGWKKFAGMNLATTVTVLPENDTVTVTIGAAEWTDKIGAGIVGAFVLWPFLATAGYGAYEQSNLPKEIFDEVSRFLGNFGKASPIQAAPVQSAAAQPRSAAPAVQKVPCPDCGALLDPDARFCPQCGKKLTLVCPECGAPVDLGSRFCKQCGHKLEE